MKKLSKFIKNKAQQFVVALIVIAALLVWQYQAYKNEPKIIEATPYRFQNHIPESNPFEEEPVRVVFDKEITLDDISYSIQPSANLQPKIRQTYYEGTPLIDWDKKYPAFVLKNKQGLPPNTAYTATVRLSSFNMFRLLFEKPAIIYFNSNNDPKPSKIETAEEREERFKQSDLGSRGGDKDYNPHTLGPYEWEDFSEYFVIDFIYSSDTDPKKDVVIVLLKGDQTRAKEEFYKFLKEKNIDQDLYYFEFYDQKTYNQ